MLCGANQDLQRCMVLLMWFKDVLEIPLLKSTDDEPITSLTPPEEVALLDEPQETQVTATCPLRYEEQDSKP